MNKSLITLVVFFLIVSITFVNSQSGGNVFDLFDHMLYYPGYKRLGEWCSNASKPCRPGLSCFNHFCHANGRVWRNNAVRSRSFHDRNPFFGLGGRACRGRRRNLNCFCRRNRNCKSGRCIENTCSK